jgi:DNA-binding SARP family transcriptional activator
MESALRAIPPAGRRSEIALPDPLRTGLVEAVAVYHGPFFDGCSNNWAIVEREKFTSIYLRILSCLTRDCEMQHEYDQALDYARQILAIDPFREQVQCEVMWLCVLVGQRVRALAQYREYQALLADELAIQPMAETRALYELIQSDRFSEQPTPSMPGPSRDHPVRSVMAAIERSLEAGYRNGRPRFS